VLIASAGDDGTIRLWGKMRREDRTVLPGHTGKVRAVAFGPGRLFASVGDDKIVRLWEGFSDEDVRPRNLGGAAKGLECVAISP